MIKRLIIISMVMIGIINLTGCKETSKSGTTSETSTVENSYEQISQKEAKALMDTEKNYIILDVRTAEEFCEAHIECAILIPDYEIGEKAEEILADKEQLILIYCRSGRRSKNASAELAKMGYTNIKEFGGIIDWKYGTVTK